MKNIKKIVLLLLCFGLASNILARDKYVYGFPTIYSDYEGFFRWDCYLDQYEEGTMQYNSHLRTYETRFYMNKEMCNYWLMLYRMEDGTYTKRKLLIEWGDSIIDGKSYARTTVDDKDTLLYRQDEGKVYCRTKNGEELLLIDFDLEVGDTFINPLGKKFTVTEKGSCDDPNIVSMYDGEARPVQLSLISEDGEGDTWVESLGSVHWGILPLYLTDGMSSFDSKPVWSKPLNVVNIVSTSAFEVNEETYKLSFFPIKDYYDFPEYYREHRGELGFSFIGDTLFIQGIMELNILRSYAECVLNGNVVDVGIHQYIYVRMFPTGLGDRYFEAKVPGFKAGTYIVNGQTLVCKGADGIEPIQNELVNGKSSNSKSIYDLSGRRVSPSSALKGVYIQNGKKVLVKQ